MRIVQDADRRRECRFDPIYERSDLNAKSQVCARDTSLMMKEGSERERTNERANEREKERETNHLFSSTLARGYRSVTARAQRRRTKNRPVRRLSRLAWVDRGRMAGVAELWRGGDQAIDRRLVRAHNSDLLLLIPDRHFAETETRPRVSRALLLSLSLPLSPSLSTHLPSL